MARRPSPRGSEAPAVEAVIGTRVRPTAGAAAAGEPELLGAHKLARWRASVPVRPEVDTMRVAVAVRGPLGLALVQSQVIEPLVSLAAIRAGFGAATGRRDRAGRSNPPAARPLAQRKDEPRGARPRGRPAGARRRPGHHQRGPRMPPVPPASASVSGSVADSAGCVCRTTAVRADAGSPLWGASTRSRAASSLHR